MRSRPGARRRRHAGTTRREVRRNRALALAILAVLALAAIAPAGQASDQSRAERAAQRALVSAQRAAERESARLDKAAEKLARREAKAHHQAIYEANKKRHALHRAEALKTTNADVTIECTQIVVAYHGFNEAGSPNAVSTRVLFKEGAGPQPTVTFPLETFFFDGSTATQTIPIAAPLGRAAVVLKGRFNTNGVRGGFSVHAPTTCQAIPRFTIETLQSLEGPFTSETLEGQVGQIVTYQTLVGNTGNTSLAFGAFSDPGCDSAVEGGTGAPVLPREKVTFVCSHTLTESDRLAGAFADAAAITGTPPAGQGEAATLSSAGVLVSPIAAGPEKGTPKPPTSTGNTTTTGGKEITTVAGPSGKAGVLGFSSAAVPSLLGPARCVRGIFTVGVKSPGVANVTFYLDGRRLARRTAHSSLKGTIGLRVNGAKLKPGKHRLSATITMTPSPPTAKALVAARARTVRRCGVAKHAPTH
ncbi:MAG TPA: hypothetical protein VF927_04255 [Solirubrobacteraceae bacterium]